jgi:hypothetical protein
MASQDSLGTSFVSDSLKADSLFVEDDFVMAEDTVQVAFEDDEQNIVMEEPEEIEKTAILKTKEPVWNPRRRR